MTTDFQGAIQRIAFEIMGIESKNVRVSQDGMTVTTVIDGEKVTTPVWEFLRDASDMVKSASEES